MSEALPTPIDVRLMNAAAALLYAACGVLLAAAAVWWALRHPLFAIGGITVHGEVAHYNVATLRANVMPRLAAGNVFHHSTCRDAREGIRVGTLGSASAVVRRAVPEPLPRVELRRTPCRGLLGCRRRYRAW
jgi:cell division protein FtsQ